VFTIGSYLGAKKQAAVLIGGDRERALSRDDKAGEDSILGMEEEEER